MEIKNKIVSDLGKGVTFGDADGPNMFIPEFGFIVPTFIDPRNDLIPELNRNRFKRLSHHVPFSVRGNFTALDWPEDFRKTVEWRENEDGLVLCDACSERSVRADKKCSSKAVNRSRYCRSHGGALHPLDKKMSSRNIVTPPQDRVARLNRPQKFMQGFLDISEISDEEIQGMFIYNDDGSRVSSMTLGVKIHQQLAQELHRRMNRFLQTKTASMLNVMVDIAESDLVEPADRIKAAQWVAERTLGKTPEVIMHGKVDAPYESIFETIDAGSREDYREKVSSTRLELGGGHDPFVDVEIVEEPEDSDNGEDGEREADSSDREHGGNGNEETGNSLASAQRSDDRREELDRQKEIKKARTKAKQRRFAARAVGASLHDMPWMIEWKFIPAGEHQGNFKLKLVCPDDLSENRLARIEKSNASALALAQQWRNNVA